MNRKIITFLITAIILTFAIVAGCNTSEDAETKDTEDVIAETEPTPTPEPEKYMGQTPPGLIPEIFASGIISTPEDMEYACTFSPDGKTIYFSVRKGKSGTPKVYISELVDDVWSQPNPIEIAESGFVFEPHITSDGKTMYFTGRITAVGESISRTGIWKRTYTDQGWSNLSYVNGGMYVSTTNDGTMYMTDIVTNTGIVKVIENNGDYTETVTLVGGPNDPIPGIHPCIAPDESYIIYDCNRPDGYGGEGDLYVSFNNGDGTWSEGINLGPDINSEDVEFTASFTPDGKYILFMKDHDLHWVDAKIIDQFRP